MAILSKMPLYTLPFCRMANKSFGNNFGKQSKSVLKKFFKYLFLHRPASSPAFRRFFFQRASTSVFGCVRVKT
jgi:hypothetical protein